MLLSLYLSGRNPCCHFDRRLKRPQGRFRHKSQETNSCTYQKVYNNLKYVHHDYCFYLIFSGWMTVNKKLERMWKEAVMSNVGNALHLSGGTEKNHENPQSC
jgi:hypothetical protein